jgi:hypothetical protein
MDDSHAIRSPSGLLTRAAWEREIQSSHGVMPRWWRSAEQRDRQFLAWVEAEALGLAAQLARLDGGAAPALGRASDTLRDALLADAAWARAATETAALQGPAPSVRRTSDGGSGRAAA